MSKIQKIAKKRQRMRQQIDQAKVTVETLWRDGIPVETLTRPVPQTHANREIDDYDNLSLSPMSIPERNSPGNLQTPF